MDMLGWDGNNDSVADLHVRPVANSLQLADKAIESNSVYAIGLNLHIVNPGTGATDHAAFWDNGYTAIGINEEYDGDFNPFWHSSADSLGQFNLPFYEKCAKLAYATLADCALDSIISSGISDVWEQPPFIIYPNPASAKLNIEIGSVYHNNSIIQLTDVLGKIYYQELLLNKNSLEINLQNLQSGFYIIKFNNGQNSYSSTLVINK
ncbi:MAG: T9SS type A sorting domain-containing protein [Saprospiraceae bacterium]|nr:T9SS type A sorting domain-containing protein [Saprospiraceae bacterium]